MELCLKFRRSLLRWALHGRVRVCLGKEVSTEIRFSLLWKRPAAGNTSVILGENLRFMANIRCGGPWKLFSECRNRRLFGIGILNSERKKMSEFGISESGFRDAPGCIP